MLFGLGNAPTTFQCAMDTILSEEQWKNWLFYKNGGIIFSQKDPRPRARNESRA